MTQDAKGETSSIIFVFLVGAIVIGMLFLTVASDFIDAGTSPVYALFFFVPIYGVFCLIVVLAWVINSVSSSTKNKTELSDEDTSSEITEKREKTT